MILWGVRLMAVQLDVLALVFDNKYTYALHDVDLLIQKWLAT